MFKTTLLYLALLLSHTCAVLRFCLLPLPSALPLSKGFAQKVDALLGLQNQHTDALTFPFGYEGIMTLTLDARTLQLSDAVRRIRTAKDYFDFLVELKVTSTATIKDALGHYTEQLMNAQTFEEANDFLGSFLDTQAN